MRKDARLIGIKRCRLFVVMRLCYARRALKRRRIEKENMRSFQKELFFSPKRVFLSPEKDSFSKKNSSFP
jgi:hypothetical protein